MPTSREMSTAEFLLYQAAGRLPEAPDAARFPPIERFAATIAEAIRRGCASRGLELPELVVEPGRAVVSTAGVLLLTIGAIKRREGVGTWAITDGGAGTVAFPLFYEYHEVSALQGRRGAGTRQVLDRRPGLLQRRLDLS